MKENKKYNQRDSRAEELKQLLSTLGLRFLNEVIDTENNDKRLTFQYGPSNILVGVRATCQRYVVLATGPFTELLLRPLPQGFTKVADGIRIGGKGKSYPKTIEHALDQVRLFKNEIDLRKVISQ